MNGKKHQKNRLTLPNFSNHSERSIASRGNKPRIKLGSEKAEQNNSARNFSLFEGSPTEFRSSQVNRKLNLVGTLIGITKKHGLGRTRK
jgi:hypothetical protein